MIKAKEHLGRSLCVLLAVGVGTLAVGLGSAIGNGGGSAPNTDTVSVSGVIERYVQACGGPALAEVKAEKRKGTLVRGQSGQVPFDTISKAPGKWLYNQIFSYGDQVSYGCDGTAAWIQDTKSVDSLTGAQRLDLEILLDVHAPLRLREFFPEMSLQGIEKRSDREVVLIQAESREGRKAELAFDKESGLLLKAGDLAFEDYRPVGKVKRPHRVYIGDDPAGFSLRLKMDFTEMVQNIPVADSLFSRPSCVLPMKVSPLFQPRRYIKVGDEALQACVGIYQHPSNPGVTYTVTRQQNHLMMERTGWGQALEIKPESELDYSIRFLNFEFHFVRDSAGRVTALELGPERSARAERIK
ncbi:MAG: hypothetical protein OEW18_05505 [Candidatus Aminicenantes bacterium]|nr:hypothetical protein [Candidatus Aminicenantes bacterium]